VLEPDAAGRDFSQFGEQAPILENTPRIGTFLEIGAWDAWEFSNVRALYENGWGGVLVEPQPGHAERLRKAYAWSLAVTVLELAVAPVRIARSGQPVRLAMTDDAMSTADPDTFAKWAGQIAYSGSVDVAVTSMPALWESHGPFQFVSIDAEGWSVPIFQDLLQQCRPLPPCLCVEYDHRYTAVVRLARGCGYRVALENGTNVVLAL